ncbi:uncharacterized protein LAJ45_03574 [Morchella importuna]|uniref:uncharacterized protein n=1 Tax=Morchella importuna TaxID=1174673 RepID=UPI001E8D6474|nr:uncharacterized protein LAJ45_03574 [Morchella importuna]KAH8152148.1 hypothetical protein LAJ45_03574 [Morchella importuna]
MLHTSSSKNAKHKHYVSYDLMDENTADPTYLEYNTLRKAHIQYKLIDHQAQLTKCFIAIGKVALEELKGVRIDLDSITDAVEYRINNLEVEIAEHEVEVEYNEKLVNEAE